MPRDVDDRKKRQALRKLRRAAQLAEAGLGPPLSDWEREFLEEVEARIETYGSAFGDPDKGDLDEPLSALQKMKLKEIDKKARGKGKKPFRKPLSRNAPERSDDTEHERPSTAADIPKIVPKRSRTPKAASSDPPPPGAPAPQPNPPAKGGRPAFRVIDGGKSD